MRNGILKILPGVGGPLLIICSIVLIEVFAWQGWRLPNPTIVLLPLTIAATLLGGLGPGVAAAVLSTLYFIWINHIPEGAWLDRMAPRGWTAIIATMLVVPLAEMGRRRFLAESDERFRTMADNIAQFAWMADERGRIFWYNRRWYEYTGTMPEEVSGFEWQKLVRPDHQDRVAARSRASFESGEMWEDTFPLRAGDGSYHWFLTRAVPVRDKRGRIKRWFGTNTDITVQREVEQKLLKLKETLEEQVAERTAVAELRADQLRNLAMEIIDAEQRERGRLAKVLHDDLQQLLVAARMQVALACRAGGAPERGPAAEDLITQAIEAARSLSKELAPPVLYEQGLGAAIEWLAHAADERYGLRVEVQREESGEAENLWVRTFLFEILRELLLNVAKHAATDQVRVALRRAGGEVRLVVEDFGKGFEVAAIRQSGGGSGLFFLQQRITLMGGQVAIDSAPGEGTRVAIRLPLTAIAHENGSDANPAFRGAA